MSANASLDRVLDPSYLEGLQSRSGDELRAMRDECVAIEDDVSFLRRLAQARIEILEAEQERRASGASVEELIARLPKILAGDQARAPASRSRLRTSLPPQAALQWPGGLERLVSDDTLANLPTLDDGEVADALVALREFESELSSTRRRLHGVIDGIEHEVAGRQASSPGG